jgi:hypothetical protein
MRLIHKPQDKHKSQIPMHKPKKISKPQYTILRKDLQHTIHKTKGGSSIHDIQLPRESPNPDARQQDKILSPRKRTQGRNLISTRISSGEMSPS